MVFQFGNFRNTLDSLNGCRLVENDVDNTIVTKINQLGNRVEYCSCLARSRSSHHHRYCSLGLVGRKSLIYNRNLLRCFGEGFRGGSNFEDLNLIIGAGGREGGRALFSLFV